MLGFKWFFSIYSSPFIVKKQNRIFFLSKISALALFSLFLCPSLQAQVEADFSTGGGVRIGDSTSTCDGTTAGALRYDADGTNKVGFCDGITWLDLTAGGVVNNGNSFTVPMILGTNDSQVLQLETNDSTHLTIDTSGNVGLGTTTPRGQLDVDGDLITKAATDNTSSTIIDFSTGNFQYTNDNCQPYTFHNAKDGGTYNFIIKGTTSATCSFTVYSDNGSTLLTLHLPGGHGTTTTGEHTFYTIMVFGSDAYFSWVTAFD